MIELKYLPKIAFALFLELPFTIKLLILFGIPFGIYTLIKKFNGSKLERESVKNDKHRLE